MFGGEGKRSPFCNVFLAAHPEILIQGEGGVGEKHRARKTAPPILDLGPARPQKGPPWSPPSLPSAALTVGKALEANNPEQPSSRGQKAVTPLNRPPGQQSRGSRNNLLLPQTIL